MPAVVRQKGPTGFVTASVKDWIMSVGDKGFRLRHDAEPASQALLPRL